MKPNKKASAVATILTTAVFLLATGCSTTPPVNYSGLASAPQLQPNTQSDADTKPYVYAGKINWREYSSMLIDPVAIYTGADEQFGSLKQADRQELADYMAREFETQMGKRFRITRAPAPGTLRLKLTLTGAKANTALVSTFTRFDLVGLPYNAIQGIRGKEGIFMGSVSYSVELYDSSSNRLLTAFVAKQHPNAMNIAATFGSLGAAKTGIEKGASQLLDEFK